MESSSNGLDQTIELLKGPTDERRCTIGIWNTANQRNGTETAHWCNSQPANLCLLYSFDVLESIGTQIKSIARTRFVGLLMAAKTLPPGDEQAIKSVYDAAGRKFFKRLLLPLQGTQVGRIQD